MKAQALDDMREGLRRAERRELEALQELDEVKAERDALKAEAGDLRSLSKGREVAHARVREQRDTALRERDEARAALLKATGALMKQYVTAPTSELEALIDECFAAAPKESE